MKVSELFPPREVLPFRDRLAIGKDFEGVVSRFLTSQGFPIRLHLSRERQWEFGESAAHCEIKLDRKWQETGNLFIETKERRNANGSSMWRPAGIYDETGPWFYVIGTPEKIWMLPVSWLIRMDLTEKYRKVATQTSEGFLVPVSLADKVSIRYFLDILATSCIKDTEGANA